MVVAGVEWAAHTKFQPNRRSFAGWTCISKKLWRFGGYRQNFILEWMSLGCSDWAENLCGNVYRVEENLLKISRDLHTRFGRCFNTSCGSWARHARSWDIWRALALLEGTSLGHREICSCVFKETLYGGSCGGMRSRHRISAQSEVVWRVNLHFEKTAKVWRLRTEFHVEMAVNVMPRSGLNCVWERF